MKKNKLYLLSILILITLSVKSQEYFEVGNIHYMFSPNNNSEFPENKVNYSNYKGNIKYPIVLKNKNILILGLFGQSAVINNTSSALQNYSLYNTELNATWLKIVDKSKSFILTFAPQIASDFKDISGKDIRFDVNFGFINTMSERFKMLYFLRYQHEYYGPAFYPVIGFNWKVSEKFKIYALLPTRLDIKYIPNKKLEIGFESDITRSTYRLSEQYNNNSYIEVSRMNESVYANFGITDNILIRASLGYTIGRFFKEYDNDIKHDFIISAQKFGNSDHTHINNNFEDGYFTEIKLIYRVKKQ